MESTGMLLLLACGCLLTRWLGFVQLRRPFAALRLLTKKRGGDGISPFEALSTSLGACIGTGNIAGVAGAILLGGPGALVWMWLSALICSASKYAEIYFALRLGGSPMAYMANGLSKNLRFLAPTYGLLCLLGCLCMGNLVQINTVAEAAEAVFATSEARLPCGLLIAGLTALVTFGGAARVGRAASFLVPFMSVLYIVAALVVIGKNLPALPGALVAILRGVMAPRALTGGAVGFFAALGTGLSRGVFTHEAGLGTAALAHGATAGVNPHAEALLGVFEVFFDTIVLCTLTGLAILVSGVPLAFGSADLNGALVINAFASALPARFAALFIAGSLALFAFTSILSFSLYGTSCAEYLFGRTVRGPFRLLFCLLLVAGAVLPAAAAWKSAGLINALMAAVNAPALLLLSARLRRGNVSGPCFSESTSHKP